MDARARPTAALRRRRDRPDQPDALDLARRERRRVPRRRLRRSCARPTPSRCAGSIDGGVDAAPDRDDLRHAEREGRDRRDRARCSTSAARELPILISVTITDRSGRTLSGQTIEAFWTSIAHARAALGRHQLRARRARDAARTWPSSRRSRRLRVSCYPNAGPAQRVRRLRRDARADGGAAARVRRERARQPASAAAAAPPPSTSARSPQAVAGVRAARGPGARAARSPALQRPRAARDPPRRRTS